MSKGQVDGGADKSVGAIGPFISAAIDFGTTFSGYAFSFKHEYNKDPCQCFTFPWPGALNLTSLKTSTCVLFKPDKTFHSFGYDAEDYYAELASCDTGELKDWYYFRRFKMQLFDKKVLKKSFQIKDETGKPMDAVKVFGYGIKFLKDHLFYRVKRKVMGVRDGDIRYVLTVPAIWYEGAKLIMKEAAELACIAPDHLLIALEPEAASVYCKHIDLANFQGMTADFKPFAEGSRYIILDAGGGTIDITVHEVQPDGHLKELYFANGGAWDGTCVDKCFEDFLREVTDDDIIDEFKTTFVGEYLDIFKEFEVKKRDFKEGMRDTIMIRLDFQISAICEEKKGKRLKEAIAENVKYGKTGMAYLKGDKLWLKKEICFKFFDKAMKSIGDHLEALMKRPECKGADTVLMVGGFSESSWLQKYISKRFSNKKVIVPKEPGLAVLKGAVIFGHDPSAISERTCRFNAEEVRTVDYNMSFPNRGKALIINNKNFVQLNDREGTDVDANALRQIFLEIGFNVEVCNNLAAYNMLEKLRHASFDDDFKRQSDCFVCTILTHGENGKVYGSDDKPVEVKKLLDPFKGNNCKSLVGKPKIFFIQACQGNMEDAGVSPDSGVLSKKKDVHVDKIPTEADFLTVYSTVPGYVSWRNHEKGSWFIQALTDVLAKHWKSEDLLSMMTLVNQKVAHDFGSSDAKQMPCITSILTKKVYFTEK